MPRHGLRFFRRAASLPMAVASVVAISTVVLVVHSSTAPGLADPVHPPLPPTYVPTPIGPPPAPPTPSPTPTVPPTATTTTTATSTPAAAARLDFSLDAVRVAKVNNPGNLRGLTAVRPGSTIWLMMYYTVNSLPKKMTRITTYTITYRGRIMFQAVYRGPIKPTETGRRSRYTVYTVPRSAAYGSYRFKAKLAIGKQMQAKSWKFAVGKQERETAAVTP